MYGILYYLKGNLKVFEVVQWPSMGHFCAFSGVHEFRSTGPGVAVCLCLMCLSISNAKTVAVSTVISFKGIHTGHNLIKLAFFDSLESYLKDFCLVLS